MKGTIKFYSLEKGYGFIYTDEYNSDIYFNINDWKNPSVPNGNDDIEFDTIDAKKGKKAINIKLIKSSTTKKDEKKHYNDDRVVCPKCAKKIVPRIIIYGGEPQKSVCPYCAAEVQKFTNCFIATAVYEDTYHDNVVILRKFRDNYLLTNNLGKKFVNNYYKNSPKIADFIKNKKFFTAPVKLILDAFVFMYKILSLK